MKDSNNEPPSTTSDRPNATLKFLLARRLVEAGVRCVSISLSDFDTHSNNFGRLRKLLPILDHGLTTLIAVPFNGTAVGSAVMKFCERADSLLLRIPLIQRHAWSVLITLTK